MRKIQKVNAKEHKDESGKICPFYGNIIGTMSSWESPSEEPNTIPTKYGECPSCGRRLKLKIVFGHDCELYYELPRHKKKGWWRKPKKQSRDVKAKRTR